MANVTGLSGFLQTFLTPVVLIGIIYYMPVYFQACKGALPTASGVDAFGLAFSTAPAGIVSGISVAISHGYRFQLWLGWMLVMIGAGLLSTLHADTSRGAAIIYMVVVGCGLGVLSTTTYFPVLAPLHVSSNAAALSLFTFLRNFAQVWGVTIGGTILQNGLHTRLPTAFSGRFPQGTTIAYAVIPFIGTLDEPLKTQVQDAFAESLRVLWLALIGVGGMGLLVSLTMRALPLHTSTGNEWGLAEGEVNKIPAMHSYLLSNVEVVKDV